MSEKSGYPGSQPPCYEDATNASAPPPEFGPPYPMANQPPCPPTSQQPPYPQPQQPAPYSSPQQPAPYPAQPYQQSYPTSYPAPTVVNYGAAPSPAYSAPPAQYPPQAGFGQPTVASPGAQGQYNYNTVTVVSNTGAVGRPVTYAPLPNTSAGLIAQNRDGRRLCFITIGIFCGIFLFGIIMAIVVTTAMHMVQW